MSKSLNALRKKWEGHATLVTGVATNNFAASVVKVGNAYWVYRYFKLAGNWEVSADLSNGSVDEAFSAYTKALALKF